MKNIIKKIIHKFGYKLTSINEDIDIVEKNDYENNLIKKIKDLTLTTDQRIWLLIQSFKHLNSNNITGDFVECGVWRGGNLILLAELCLKYNLNKNIIGFDTFEGMTEPNDYDLNYRGKSAKKNLNKYINNKDHKDSIWQSSSLEMTSKYIKKKTKYNNIKLIKGDVAKTLKKSENLPKKISLLRLDTDFYESTKLELEVLYPLLVKGGILIIDDYGQWKGCKKAVDEYFQEKSNQLFFCDFSCRYIIKTDN